MRVFVGVIAIWLCFAVGPSAQADDAPPTAQQLFERGVEQTKAEQWADAQASFEKSLALEARAATYLNLAIVRYRLGEYVAALTALEAFERDAGMQEDVRKRAQWLRDKLAQQVVRFQLHIDPSDAVIEIDGQAQSGAGADRPLWLTPGQHEVRASAPGYVGESMRIVATAGAATTASIELKVAVTSIPATLAEDPNPGNTPMSAPPSDAAPPARPLWKNPWLWTAIGVVVVGGAVTAGLLLRTEEKAPSCDPKNEICL